MQLPAAVSEPVMKWGSKRCDVSWPLGERRERDLAGSIQNARGTALRPLFQQYPAPWRCPSETEGAVSSECGLVVLDMSDEFRLSNTLFGINF